MSIPLDVLVRAVMALEAAQETDAKLPMPVWNKVMQARAELGGYVTFIARAQKVEVAA